MEPSEPGDGAHSLEDVKWDERDLTDEGVRWVVDRAVSETHTEDHRNVVIAELVKLLGLPEPMVRQLIERVRCYLQVKQGLRAEMMLIPRGHDDQLDWQFTVRIASEQRDEIEDVEEPLAEIIIELNARGGPE